MNTHQQCALCERQVGSVSLHHLVPREEGGRFSETVPLCQPCHSTIHRTYSNRELARLYHTIPLLQQAPGLQKYLNWIRKRPIERISNFRARR
ncbi:HNH endonuclease [Cesiribacter andamanensis]|uniref:HNH endonuclease n=1 Tax=Cesiribacter andamanensis AMV16 TaxID=1279009 RepID=M7N3K9_9BACT|nr:HNH endonuclease signature motif containing protein [Cesiribacter andamanensis]EMR01882.1 HNH endonuclease [Cesiribacter andamanensis AMV16]